MSPASGHVRKQLDPSKTAFLTQPNVQETDTNNKILELLSQDKLEQYLDRNNEISNVNQVSICIQVLNSGNNDNFFIIGYKPG